MLKALGVGASPAATVGFSAAIKWVMKDGIGALGRLLVGGRLSTVFDEDPKRWRMIAEAVTTTGLGLEIATQLSPDNFVLLAGTGTLCKATGRGMGRPSFRVIQTHFASIENNVGDVAAKEEVWEVAGQLVGLAASVALLNGLENSGQGGDLIVPLWVGVHTVHVTIRYLALRTLEFPYPNYKRGAALVRGWIEKKEIASIQQVNSQESVIQGPWEGAGGVQCILGCSVSDFLSKEFSLKEACDLYNEEKYMLSFKNGVSYVVLWDKADASDILRALYQATWLTINTRNDIDSRNSTSLLAESLAITRQEFPYFLKAAKEAGWEVERGVFPLHSPYRIVNVPPTLDAV